MSGTRVRRMWSARRRGVASDITRSRRGVALVLVLISIVVFSVLSTGAILGSLQELRSAKNEQMEQRALAVAEYGLNFQLSNWPASRAALTTGAIETSNVVVATGDTAQIVVMRLNTRNYLVVSIGRTNSGSGRLGAQRQVSLLVTAASGSAKAPAALTSKGNNTTKGSASITGINTTPLGWTGCAAARDTFALASAPNKNIDVQKPASQSVNGTYKDPNANKQSTYDTFGDETFNSLKAKAAVKPAEQPSSPSPSGNSVTCTAGPSNWGEPYRSGSYTAGCTSYYPIVYAANNLKMTGGRGQGVLLVNGNLDVTGNFYYVGLIVVTGNIKISGTSVFRGALLAQGNIDSEGNTDVAYSACAISNALGGSAGSGAPAVSRVAKRGWVQNY